MRWLRAVPPARLAAIAAVLAAVAVGLFAASVLLRGAGPSSGVLSVDPASLGLQGLLDGQGVLDSDRDGLADARENLVYGSDPGRWNTSGGSIPDGWLARFGFDPNDPGADAHAAASPPAASLPPAYHGRWPDQYVLTLAKAYAFHRPANWSEADQGPFDSGIDPREWDQDGDGLPDGWLVAHGLDPLQPGLAGSRLAGPGGLTVAEAFQHGTDPRKLDSDGDGLDDRVEIDGAPNPKAPQGPARFPPSDPARADTAGAGVCDGYLVRFGLDPGDAANSLRDLDRDGATTRQEFAWSRNATSDPCRSGGLDPLRQATAGAPIPDGWLIAHGLDPLKAGVANLTTQRANQDARPAGVPAPASDLALTVLQEYRYGRPPQWLEAKDGPWLGGTDPASNDTDHDGLGDAWEIAGYRIHVAAEPAQPAGADITARPDPTSADGDGDGLADLNETRQGTDAGRADTDFDGLDDGVEAGLKLGLDLLRADSTSAAGPGDLMLDGARYALLQARSQAAEEGKPYPYAGPPGPPRALSAWASRLPGAARLGSTPSDHDLAGLLAPGGDANGNGVVNVLDPDIDGDGVPNGPETDPSAYRDTRFGLGPLGARPATDPLNPDTDGDLLRDGWEVEHGLLAAGGLTLDPAQWDSDGDCAVPAQCRNDGQEDPDADGITWPRFVRDSPSAVPRLDPQAFPFTNVREQDAKTDPNVAESDGDGLLDGWKAFWANDYPARPRSTAALGEFFPASIPEAPRPTPGSSQNESSAGALLSSRPYWRSALQGAPLLLEHGEREVASVAVRTGGGTIQVANVTGAYRITFQEVQRMGTNPYLQDTDGDGMPDWWERLHAVALPGMPAGADCVPPTSTPPGLDPLLWEGDGDLDGDGLANAAEYAAGSDPLCADSDLGGVPDGIETKRSGQRLDPSNPRDDASLLDQHLDQDGDGATDYEEITSLGTRLDDPDTDGDGLLDGPSMPASGTCWPVTGSPGTYGSSDPAAQRLLDLGMAYEVRGSCLVVLGEGDPQVATDPLDGDDRGVGIPEGWLLMKQPGLDPSSPSQVAQALAHYTLGRPAWWSEGVHGPWWGGADPQAGSRPDIPDQPLASLRGSHDLDGDGLADTDAAGGPSEDVLPAANRANAVREVAGLPPGTNPRDGSIDPLVRRLAAQAMLSPAPYAQDHRNTVAHATFDAAGDARPDACLTILAAPSTLVKGEPATISGRLERPGCGAGAAGGVAVEALLAGQAFGAAFTQPDGSFSLEVNVTSALHSLAIPDGAASAFRGESTGEVAWIPDGGAPGVGAQSLTLRSYGTAALRPALATAAVTVKAGSVLDVDVPAETRTDRAVPARVTLHDSAGGPLHDPIRVLWDGQRLPDLAPAPDGSVDVVLPPVPAARAGAITLDLRSQPASADTEAAQYTGTVLVRRPSVLDLDEPQRADAGSTAIVRGQLRDLRAGGVEKGVAGVTVRVELAGPGGTVEAQAVTASDGRFQADLALPADLPAGSQTLRVASAGTPATAPAATEATLPVRGVPRFDEVSTGLLLAGTGHEVRGRLADAAGQPLAGASVQVTLGDVQATATTDASGRLAVTVQAKLAPGPAVQALRFGGDELHTGAEQVSQRSVSSATSLHLAGGVLARGADADVPVTLLDANGAGVAGAIVRVRWGQEPVREVVTDAHGLGHFLRPAPSQEALGSVLVRASYAGSDAAGLAPSNASQGWSVQALARLELPSGLAVAGDPSPVVRLLDAGTGAPLAHRPLTRGTPPLATTVTTDLEGRIPLLAATPPADADPALVDIPVAFAGDGEYPAVKATVRLHLVSPVSLRPDVPATLVTGSPALVHAELVDGRGQPASGGTVEVRLGNVSLGRAPVTASPLAVRVLLPSSTPAGPATLTFHYSGSDTHAPSNGTASVVAVRGASLTILAKPAREGGDTVVRVRLSVGDEPLADRKVLLLVDGAAGGLEATTNETGIATFRIAQSSAQLAVVARAPGDAAVATASGAALLEARADAAFAERSWPAVAIGIGVVALALGAVAAFALRPAARLDAALRGAQRALQARGPDERRVLEAYRILEDAAIALEVLSEPANTPRILEGALAPLLPRGAQASLGRLISVFEVARYGEGPLPRGQRDVALDSLAHVRSALGQGGHA